MNSFEPSLTFLQLIASRWSKGDQMLIAGGWESFATPGLKWMITDPEAPAKLYGNISVCDREGRIAIYDVMHPTRQPLGEHIKAIVPRGVSVEETTRRLKAFEKRASRSREINRIVFYIAGSVLVVVVILRLLLVWERTRSRGRAVQRHAALSAGP